jgi:hypothetical protein
MGKFDLNRPGSVRVPPTYESDQPTRIVLDRMAATVAEPRHCYGGEMSLPRVEDKTPIRLEMTFYCNAEAVRRLAEFFGAYDPEGWSRQSAPLGLPMAALPPKSEVSPKEIGDGVLEGEFVEDEGEDGVGS